MPEQPYGRSSSRSTGNGRSRRRRGYQQRRSGRDIRTADMAAVNGGPRHVLCRVPQMFCRLEDPAFEIYTMALDGSGIARLTNNGRPDIFPDRQRLP